MELKEPKEWDKDHLEQHIMIVKQMRLIQLKIERLLEAVTVLNDNFAKIEKMTWWMKAAYDVAVHNLQAKFEETVATFTRKK